MHDFCFSVLFQLLFRLSSGEKCYYTIQEMFFKTLIQLWLNFSWKVSYYWILFYNKYTFFRFNRNQIDGEPIEAAVEALEHSKNAWYSEDCQCCGFSTHAAAAACMQNLAGIIKLLRYGMRRKTTILTAPPVYQILYHYIMK